MANARDVKPVQKSETFLLGGKERTLHFDMNSFIELEERYGSVQAAMKAFQGGKLKDVRLMLWAALIHEEVILDEFGEPKGYNLTPYQVGAWLDNPSRMNEISTALATTMIGDSPDVDNLVKNNPELAKALEAEGIQIAKVVLTPEEQAAAEAEAKNG